MFAPEWPKLSDFKKLMLRANVILEESPQDEATQERALALYRKALTLQDSKLVRRNIGRIHFQRKQWDEAETAFLDAGDDLWLGLLYEWTSRYDDAWRCLKKAPVSAVQARVLARVSKQIGCEDEGIRALERWPDVDSLFELVSLYDRVGRFEDAWRTAEKANELKGLRDEKPFPRVNLHVEDEGRREAPIFIVGMPRSGTTLIERMIAQHPGVDTKGESLFFEFVAGKIQNGERLAGIGAAYLRDAPKRTVDKYPMNFRYLDLIRGVFPKARIISMNRRREDTLISCWFRNFQGNLSWSYHWDDLNRAYDRYLETMNNRHDVFPVSYEQLVLDPEVKLREILDYCGLPWNECCLRHDADGSYHDYSYEEVRRPITRDRIGRADNYAAFLPRKRELEAEQN